MNEGRGAHWSRCGGSRESSKCVDIGELLKLYIIKNVGVRIVSTITIVFNFCGQFPQEFGIFWLAFVWGGMVEMWLCMVLWFRFREEK